MATTSVPQVIPSVITIASAATTTTTTSTASSIASTVASVAAAAARLGDDADNDATAETFGIDLQAEKRSLIASTKISTNLDQIKCKDEKFLNIVVLHKKFVDIGKFWGGELFLYKIK